MAQEPRYIRNEVSIISSTGSHGTVGESTNNNDSFDTDAFDDIPEVLYSPKRMLHQQKKPNYVAPYAETEASSNFSPGSVYASTPAFGSKSRFAKASFRTISEAGENTTTEDFAAKESAAISHSSSKPGTSSRFAARSHSRTSSINSQQLEHINREPAREQETRDITVLSTSSRRCSTASRFRGNINTNLSTVTSKAGSERSPTTEVIPPDPIEDGTFTKLLTESILAVSTSPRLGPAEDVAASPAYTRGTEASDASAHADITSGRRKYGTSSRFALPKKDAGTLTQDLHADIASASRKTGASSRALGDIAMSRENSNTGTSSRFASAKKAVSSCTTSEAKATSSTSGRADPDTPNSDRKAGFSRFSSAKQAGTCLGCTSKSKPSSGMPTKEAATTEHIEARSEPLFSSREDNKASPEDSGKSRALSRASENADISTNDIMSMASSRFVSADDATPTISSKAGRSSRFGHANNDDTSSTANTSKARVPKIPHEHGNSTSDFVKTSTTTGVLYHDNRHSARDTSKAGRSRRFTSAQPEVTSTDISRDNTFNVSAEHTGYIRHAAIHHKHTNYPERQGRETAELCHVRGDHLVGQTPASSYTDEPTTRPVLGSQAALQSAKERTQRIYDTLMEELNDANQAYTQLKPDSGRRQRKALDAEIARLMERINDVADVLYDLEDVVLE